MSLFYIVRHLYLMNWLPMRVALVTLVLAIGAAWTLSRAAVAERLPAPRVEAGRVRVLVELRVWSDGMAEVSGRQVLTSSRDAVELVKRWAAEEAAREAGQAAEADEVTAGTEAGYPGQCRAIAYSTQKRCRLPSGGDPSGLCRLHRQKRSAP